MKKFGMLFSLLFCMFLMLFSSGCSKVPAGHVGIKVYLLGGEKGVESEQLGVGRYWIGFNEELYLFPTFTQNAVWTADKREGSEDDESITFQTVEGMSINADVGISYNVIPEKVPLVFQKYRKKIDEITDIYLRNMVRDAFVKIASTQPIETVYGEGKAELLKQVEETVRSQCKDMFVIERIYLISDLRLPDAVVTSLNAKIAATQKAQQRENEVREAKAEAEKAVAKAEGEARSITLVAKAQADANQILAKSITTELVQYKSIERWDGVLPATMAGGAVPFLPIK